MITIQDFRGFLPPTTTTTTTTVFSDQLHHHKPPSSSTTNPPHLPGFTTLPLPKTTSDVSCTTHQSDLDHHALHRKVSDIITSPPAAVAKPGIYNQGGLKLYYP
ncbi:hypothetical protein QVD17_28435 [Tagetes erecta]|uniref:Uncharacterized protein n=1 Tax=Tagetes erecta TaxID=13708 RepID=A0AAD8KDC0_TARER|nr:hypothetical protein QVD17_28435 [Tagetes erecta]